MVASSGGHGDDMHKVPYLGKRNVKSEPSSTNSSTNYRVMTEAELQSTVSNTPYWSKDPNFGPS